MNLIERIFGPEKPVQDQDYFKRNVGKKIMATVLMPTDAELAGVEDNQTAHENPTN